MFERNMLPNHLAFAFVGKLTCPIKKNLFQQLNFQIITILKEPQDFQVLISFKVLKKLNLIGLYFSGTTYKEPRIYTLATAFNLAYTYGEPRIMSSFDFYSHDQGTQIIFQQFSLFYAISYLGPPANSDGDLISPNPDGDCSNGWICEHRWIAIARMAQFRSVVKNTDVEHWWDNGNNQMGFGRGGKGFILFNIDWGDLNESLQTGLEMGKYCDVISGRKENGQCTGKVIEVGSDGFAFFSIPTIDTNGFIAIHVGEKL